MTNQNVQDLIDQGAIFFASHSGGKDSQCMYIELRKRYGVPANQIEVIHADLGDIEHTGVQDHIRATISHELHVVHAIDKRGERKTLLGMIEARAADRPDAPAWPSSAIRYCTSDLKRGPIEKRIRAIMKARGATLAVNCMGLRAEESPARAKKPEWQLNARLSKAGRTVHDWLPIQDYTTALVFGTILGADQRPHPVYQEGNERLSCVFCIFGSDNDLRNGARLRPDLARKYVALEQRIGRTMFHKRSLEERIGDLIPVRTIQGELFS